MHGAPNSSTKAGAASGCQGGGTTRAQIGASAGQLRSQDAKYSLTPEGDKTRVKFELTINPSVPLPGFILKRAIKGAMETSTDGLRKRVLKVKKGG